MNRNRRPQNWLNLFTLICLLLGSTPAAAIFQKKLPAATATDSSESIVDSESSLLPNAERGKRIASDRNKGDCAACHVIPPYKPEFHGSIGPSLTGVGNRYSADQLVRFLREPRKDQPTSIMPSYSRTQGLHNVLPAHRKKPLLSREEIADVVEYLLTLTAPPASEDVIPAHQLNQHLSTGPVSGTLFLSDANKTLQDDEFANPGRLWLDIGSRLWNEEAGPSHRSCSSCHGYASESMKGVRPRYPLYREDRNNLVSLQQQINYCRSEEIGAAAYLPESEDLLALEIFVSHQSHGLPIQPMIDGRAAPFFEAGKKYFFQRRGHLDLSCSDCHDRHAGRRLHGETISQGQTNAFPIYRLRWHGIGSAHRMFAWCNSAIRAEPLALGSYEYLSLELYLAWRGQGLPIEAPAIRR